MLVGDDAKQPVSRNGGVRHGYRKSKNSLESFGLSRRRRIRKSSHDARSGGRRADAGGNRRYAIGGGGHALWTARCERKSRGSLSKGSPGSLPHLQGLPAMRWSRMRRGISEHRRTGFRHVVSKQLHCFAARSPQIATIEREQET